MYGRVAGLDCSQPAMLDVCREQEQQMAHWRMWPAQHAIPDLHKQLTSTFTLTQTRS